MYLALTISFIIPTGNAPEPTAGSITLTFLSNLSNSSEFSLIELGKRILLGLGLCDLISS